MPRSKPRGFHGACGCRLAETGRSMGTERSDHVAVHRRSERRDRLAPRARVVAGLIAVLAAVAAGAGPAVDAGSAGRSSPNDELLLYHAKFTVLYEVEWHTKSGSPGQECSRWYDDRGTSKVVIEDAAWVQRKKKRRLTRADGIPGSLTVS